MTAPILVTGAAGFIGSSTVERLLERGDQVVGLDCFDPYYEPAFKRRNVAELRARFPSAAQFELAEIDVRDRTAVQALFARHRPRAVIHLAALAGVRASIGQALLYNDVNVTGTIHLLDAARDHGVECFVFASTSSVYGDTKRIPFVEEDPCDRPLAPYPASKRSCELLGHAYHHLHGLNFTALRFFTVYGPRNRPDMMAYMLLDSVVNGTRVTLFDPDEMRRDWTYVGDIAAGVVAAADKPLGYEVLNIGRGEPVLLADFVRKLEAVAGGQATVRHQAAPLADVSTTFADVSRIRSLLGYTPTTSLDEGVERLWTWFQKREG
jgi:UDP-glucuronate 4-epimerase